jgi:hypothetical protein
MLDVGNASASSTIAAASDEERRRFAALMAGSAARNSASTLNEALARLQAQAVQQQNSTDAVGSAPYAGAATLPSTAAADYFQNGISQNSGEPYMANGYPEAGYGNLDINTLASSGPGGDDLTNAVSHPGGYWGDDGRMHYREGQKAVINGPDKPSNGDRYNLQTPLRFAPPPSLPVGAARVGVGATGNDYAKFRQQLAQQLLRVR